MNEPDDVRDEELSRRYRALPPELPQPETDAAIRAAARKALGTPRHARRQRVLLGGLAMAASFTLVMALLLPSWRSGEWQEQAATRAPVEVVADAPQAVVEPSPVKPAPFSAEIAAEPGARDRRAAPAYKTEAHAGDDFAEKRMANQLQEAVTLSAAPAPAPAPAPVTGMAPAEAMARDDIRGELAVAAPKAEQTARERVTSQKARMAPPLAAAPAPTTVGMADTEAPTLEALLRADRHAEALALLQSPPMAGNAGLDSRRDLLRQLVPGADRVLQCRTYNGPASARALCRLLQGWQAGKGVAAADLLALEQALRAEGADPQSWRQAVQRLP